MVCRRYVLCVLICVVLINCVSAQSSFLFRHIDAAKGMSDNIIEGISSLPDGRIAIRTKSQLNLYNGATFDNFREDTIRSYRWLNTVYEGEYVDLKN